MMEKARIWLSKHIFVLFSSKNNIQISFPVNIIESSQFVLIKNSNKWAK